MSVQQELAEVCVGGPGPRYEQPKPKPKPEAKPELDEPLPPSMKLSAALPSLVGVIEVGVGLPKPAPIGWIGVRRHWMYTRECVNGHDLVQELVDRSNTGGETWRVYPCLRCELGGDDL